MLIPPGCPHNDVTSRLDGRANILENCMRRGKLNAHINVCQSFRPHSVPGIEYPRNNVALLASDRVDLASHFSEPDERNSHVRSFCTSFSYRFAPSMSSFLLIFSPTVCASRIDPGPISSRFP